MTQLKLLQICFLEKPFETSRLKALSLTENWKNLELSAFFSTFSESSPGNFLNNNQDPQYCRLDWGESIVSSGKKPRHLQALRRRSLKKTL